MQGGAGSPVTGASLPGRRAGLEGVEKVSQPLMSTAMTEWDAGLLLPFTRLVAGRLRG